MQIQIRTQVSTALKDKRNFERGANLIIDFLGPATTLGLEKDIRNCAGQYDHTHLPHTNYEAFATDLFKEVAVLWPEITVLDLRVDARLKIRVTHSH